MILKQSVITIGTFDGVHVAHQTILNKLVDISKKENLKSIVISFESPVKQVSGLLTTTNEKINILSTFNINEILLLPVNKKITSITADSFFEDILIKQLNVKHIVVGYDCVFGKDRTGNISWLKQKTKKYNIKLTIIEPIKINNQIVSSSKIRTLIQKNNINLVNKMLGKFFEFTGKHIIGNQIGRILGFPTLNIKVDNTKILPKGVFACSVIDNKSNLYYGVLNIGFRPTIDIKKHDLSIEVHLLNFSGVWKDKNPKIYIRKFIRNEQKFKSVDILKQTIQKDVNLAKKLFKLG